MERLLELVGLQFDQKCLSSRLSERPCLKGSRRRHREYCSGLSMGTMRSAENQQSCVLRLLGTGRSQTLGAQAK